MTEPTATAAGLWPGEDTLEACRVILGELAAPQLPVLPALPGRGAGAEMVGRTAAMLVDLPVDVQSFGWRLVQRPGADARRARNFLASDVNALADAAGTLGAAVPRIKTQLLGPFSLAAALHLPLGETLLIDHGARRELTESLAAGLAGHLAAVRAAVPGALVSVQLEEPGIAEVLGGKVPTASGYRTVRAIAATEVRAAWQSIAEAARAAGADELLFAIPVSEATQTILAPADSVGLLGPGTEAWGAADWESVAALVESGKNIQLAAPPGAAGSAAQQIWRGWRNVGLPGARLNALRLTEAKELSALSSQQAKRVLADLTDTVEALQELAEAG
ncbi:MAG: hypothetical protein IIZ13_15100 [Renibacterium sp.]|nr:hypothetical protein [Renibacterium sp.]